jgi:hypothetical protein
MMKLPRVLPVAPLIPWIKECSERETAEAFAARCGVSAKRINDFTAGRIERVQFDTMDRMISKEGSRSIIDFFPEYDDDEAFANCGNIESIEKRKNDKGCSVEECDKAHHSKGMCNRHYLKFKRGQNKTLAA